MALERAVIDAYKSDRPAGWYPADLSGPRTPVEEAPMSARKSSTATAPQSPEATKYCARRGCVRPRTEFPRDASRKDGLYPYCKPHTREKQAKSYQRHRQARIDSTRARRLANPEKTKEIAARHYRKHREAILAKLCESRLLEPEKHRDLSRRYYVNHAEQRRRRERERRLKDLDAARAKDRASTDRNRDKIQARARRRYAEDPEFAAYCRAYQRIWRKRNSTKRLEYNSARRAKKHGVDCEFVSRQVVHTRDGGSCHLCGKPVRFERMHLDHVVPLSRGGAHSYANVKVAHAKCNLRKGTKLLEEL